MKLDKLYVKLNVSTIQEFWHHDRPVTKSDGEEIDKKLDEWHYIRQTTTVR